MADNVAPSYYHPSQVTFMRKGTLEAVQSILGEVVIVKQTYKLCAGRFFDLHLVLRFLDSVNRILSPLGAG